MRNLIVAALLLAPFAARGDDDPYVAGLKLEQEGKLAQAEATFSTALATTSEPLKLAAIRRELADLYRRTNRCGRAVPLYMANVRASGKPAASDLGFLGECLHATGKNLDAIRVLDRALLDPGAASFATHWRVVEVDALLGLGKPDEALRRASDAVIHDGKSAEARRATARALVAMKRNELAIDTLAHGEEYAGPDAGIRLDLAELLRAAGKKKEAQEAFKRFLEIAPPSETEAIASAKSHLAEVSR